MSINVTSSELAPVLEALEQISSELRELRARIEGRTKSHYTVAEVAQIVGRAPYTIRTWIREGLLKAERVAGTGPRGRLLIPHAELAKVI